MNETTKYSQNDSIINNIKRIHMIGIGGSGMYPLAQILHSDGYELSGSDNNPSDTLNMVKSLGIPVFLGHKAENIGDAKLIIYSAAISKTNPELLEAERLGIPTLERSNLLGAITRKYNNVIGVSGTHGKTTVSSMLTQILFESGFDPTAVIGGRLPVIGGNGRAGKSDIMVCESCEYVDTFLKLSVNIALILNIDGDHMEYFKTMDNLINSFKTFANKANIIIVNGDDENSITAIKDLDKKIITFGFSGKNDYYPDNVVINQGNKSSFDLMHKGNKYCNIQLSVPGNHNILNAIAATVAAISVGANEIQIEKGLLNFKGAGRRFEFLGVKNGITVADDYAHHPAELTVTLNTAMKMGYNTVWAIFQPFTFSRTFMLLEDFATALKIPDKVILSEIMGSREINTYGIETSELCEKIPNAVWFKSFEEIAEYAANNAESGDLIITLGCGDIYKAAKIILNKLD